MLSCLPYLLTVFISTIKFLCSLIPIPFPSSKLNCEVLHEDSAFEIRWSVVESGETAVFQLVGRIDNGKYMAFGLSGENNRSVMVGGDAMIGWFDQTTGRGNVVDYHLGSKSVCQGELGSCPDVRLKEGTNNIRLLSAASVNGFTILTFQRKLKAFDPLDKQILTNESQPIIWAIGSMQNDLAGYHSIRSDDFSIDFGRAPVWNCPEPQPEPESAENSPKPTKISSGNKGFKVSTEVPIKPISRPDSDPSASDHGASLVHPHAWQIPPIPCNEPEDGVYYIQIGPSGRKDIFRNITGKQEVPDNVWYVNGLLMPEVSLQRYKNYTFVIQGGDNGFYITNDSVGDFEHKSTSERKDFAVYGGVELDSHGNSKSTAFGKLCRWVENGNQAAEFFASYAAYQRSLTLDCGKGHFGVLQFRPTEATPNLLYYQSYSRPNLGWKIHIVDKCGESQVAQPPVSATAPSQSLQGDQTVGESINRESVVANAIVSSTLPLQPFTPLQEAQPGTANRRIENAYLIDTTMGGGTVAFQNGAPIDTSRLIFNGKPLETGDGGMRQGHIVAVGPGNTYQLLQAPAGSQLAIDASMSDNARPPHNLYPPAGYQMPLAGDGHLMRRTGAQHQGPIQSQYKYQPHYGRQPEVYYETKPEYFIPGNRQPSMSHPVRYDNVQGHGQTIIYASTVPPLRRNGMPYIPHDKSDFSDMSMRNSGPIIRVQNAPRRPPLDNNSDNLNIKYIEYPHMPIQVLQNDARPPPSHDWHHSRNLPKRENGRLELPVYFSKDFLRQNLRRESRDTGADHFEKDLQPESKTAPRTLLVTENGRKKAVLNSLIRGSSSDLDPSPKIKSNLHAHKDFVPNSKETTGEKEVRENDDLKLEHRSQPLSQSEELEESDSDTIKPRLHLPDPVFQTLGPMFRPSPPDSDGINISTDFGQQDHPSSSNIHSDFLRDSDTISQTMQELSVAQESPFIKYRRRNVGPYKSQPVPTQHRFHNFLKHSLLLPQRPQQLPLRKPTPSASRFHEIIKLLVPVDTTSLRHDYQPFPVIRRVHPKYQLFQNRNGNLKHPQPHFSTVVATVEKTRRRNANSTLISGLAEPNIRERIREMDDKNREEGIATRENNGDSEAQTGQENLSLTLLTDVWQIINQQGISIPSEYKPPGIKQQQRTGIPSRQISSKMIIRSQRIPGVIPHPKPNLYKYQRQPGLRRGLAESGNLDSAQDLEKRNNATVSRMSREGNSTEESLAEERKIV